MSLGNVVESSVMGLMNVGSLDGHFWGQNGLFKAISKGYFKDYSGNNGLIAWSDPTNQYLRVLRLIRRR